MVHDSFYLTYICKERKVNYCLQEKQKCEYIINNICAIFSMNSESVMLQVFTLSRVVVRVKGKFNALLVKKHSKCPSINF